MLYLEATYGLRLTRSGAVCDRATGRRLIKRKGELVTGGPIRILAFEMNAYLLADDRQAYVVTFLRGHWHGGSVTDAERASEPREPA